jgi:hypothetical protein
MATFFLEMLDPPAGSDSFDRLDAAAADGVDERLVIPFVLVRIALAGVGDRQIELVAGPS